MPPLSSPLHREMIHRFCCGFKSFNFKICADLIFEISAVICILMVISNEINAINEIQDWCSLCYILKATLEIKPETHYNSKHTLISSHKAS